MVFNNERAEEVIYRLARAYEQRTHMFKYVHHTNGDAPQHRHIPRGGVGAANEQQLALFGGNGNAFWKKRFPKKVERGSRKHQIFLFFATLITYHSQSEQGFQQAVALYDSCNRLFTPGIRKMKLEQVQSALGWAGFIYPNEGGRRWKESGHSLFELFDGDPLRIFQQGTIESILDSKKENQLLIGYGPKLLSLLAIFYEELGLIDHVEGSFPADIHVQAQCIANGIVDFEEGDVVVRTTEPAEFIRKGLVAFCQAHGISPFKLSHAMWFLGNRLCWNCNRRNREQTAALCPIKQFCQGRIDTELYNRKGLWNLQPPEYPLFEER